MVVGRGSEEGKMGRKGRERITRGKDCRRIIKEAWQGEDRGQVNSQ